VVPLPFWNGWKGRTRVRGKRGERSSEGKRAIPIQRLSCTGGQPPWQMPCRKEEEERNELLQLAESVAQNAHLLVRGRGDEQLAQARRALK
jgi:hypothetical protein